MIATGGSLVRFAGKGLATRTEAPLTRPVPPPIALSAGPQPNDEQQKALRRLSAFDGRFGVLLVDGVTGSGKTEVYLRAIEAVLARDQEALVLVPEIGLTPQLIERFERRFGFRPVALHSGLTDAERLDGFPARHRRRGPDCHRYAFSRFLSLAEARPDRRRRGARQLTEAAGRLSLLGARPCDRARTPA